jgi:NTE family protein
MLDELMPVTTFEDLAVPFQCVAASIERAAEHWFSEGPLTDAILASCAVPGILPPVEIDGEHFIDGGIVNSIPISRAVELGATEIYVLHVGRIERPLEVPRSPIQVAVVAFEIARRHRFARDLAALPDGVTAHVLPTGESPPTTRRGQLAELNYRDFKAVARRIDRAHRASAKYLRSNSET